jgi:hypothetical protein
MHCNAIVAKNLAINFFDQLSQCDRHLPWELHICYTNVCIIVTILKRQCYKQLLINQMRTASA